MLTAESKTIKVMRVINPFSYLVNKALYRVVELMFRYKKVLKRRRFLSKK
jgi:hypothetical protein